MQIEELIENYLEFLWLTFMYDVSVFSQGWLYWWLLIPAFVYFVFFICKWSILLLPMYGPLIIICKTFIIISAKSTE